MADWITTGNAGTNPPNEFLGTTDQQPLVVKVAGAEALRVDLGGNVGVGTTEPQTPLHVLGRISSGADLSTAGAITLFPPDGWAWFHIDNGPTGGRPLGRMRFSYGVSPGENELMNLFQDGNIGVGTDAPEAKLKISSEGTFDAPQLHVEQTTTNDFARLRFNTADFPVGPQQTPQPKDFWDIAVGGPDNVLNIYHDSAPGVSGPGNVMTFLPVFQLGAQNQETEVVFIGIGTEAPQVQLHVVGDFRVTGTKQFVQPHPTDPTKEIIYVALEGSEAGTYFRGTDRLVNGKSVIELPKHFGLVTSGDGLTVQLTPRGEWLQLYVARSDPRQLVVQEAQGRSGYFDYFVQGVRKGYERHEIVRTRQKNAEPACA